jgi:phenylpropionate dioxygenase-like ring-hydroxylating dioxygenase large terminal subunit
VITTEENDLITQTGPGTPGGALMRHYWHPVALSADVDAARGPMPIKVLGEDLTLFRDHQGRPALLGLFCPHRCADLSYGRIESRGLRCLYHGWLFDIEGRCLEQPAERAESSFKDEIRHTAYPCVERAGLIFVYMGGGEPPLFPDYEFLRADGAHLFIERSILKCNYLQALEGNIDPAHLSFLHRPFAQNDNRAVPGSNVSAEGFYRGDLAPTIKTQPTTFGLRIFSIRRAGPEQSYVRITNFIMPNKAAVVGEEGRVGEGYAVHWHVPMTDTEHMRFDIAFNRERPIDRDKYLSRSNGEILPDGRLLRTKDNRYLQDRSQMESRNFTGMGDYFPAHDAFASETPGLIHDRTREHLASSDICIVAARRQLLAGIQAVVQGKDPLHVIRSEQDNKISALIVASHVVPNQRVYEFWKRDEIARS